MSFSELSNKLLKKTPCRFYELAKLRMCTNLKNTALV